MPLLIIALCYLRLLGFWLSCIFLRNSILILNKNFTALMPFYKASDSDCCKIQYFKKYLWTKKFKFTV